MLQKHQHCYHRAHILDQVNTVCYKNSSTVITGYNVLGVKK